MADERNPYTAEMARKQKRGFKVVSQTTLDQRRSICGKCPHWDKDRYLGQGACKLCNCPGSKLVLAEAACPDNPPRWLAAA